MIRNHSPPGRFLSLLLFYLFKKLYEKNTFLLCMLLLCMQVTSAQLTKGNWLMGGKASLASSNFETNDSKLTAIDLSPDIGYFFVDRLAAGIRMGYSRSKTKFGDNPSQPGTENSFESKAYSIGPFIRYYFLPIENRYNILTELNYQYINSKLEINNSNSSTSSSNQFSIAAGPAIYLNSSVALEFLVGYSITPKNKSSAKSSKVGFGIGFQIHLEKEKN